MILWLAATAQGASLADQLAGLLEQEGFQRSDAEVPVLMRTVLRGADFPTVAATPDFTYRYNPATDTFERIARSLGPIFLKTPRTVGKGVLEIGASYLYADLSERDGQDLPATESRFRLLVPDAEGRPVPLNGRLIFTDFDLSVSMLFLSMTYGLTARWDINVLVPGVRTELHVRARREVEVEGQTVPFGTSRIDDDKVGLGDVQVGTKYRVVEGSARGLSAGLTLRLPTGNEENFHGQGDTIVVPVLAVFQGIGPHDLHLNVAPEINADDLERTRVHYGLGAAIRAAERLTVLIEIIGDSGIVDDEFTVPVAARSRRAFLAQSQTKGSVRRTDIVDLGVALKGQLFKSVVGFAGVLLPLNSAGVRADVVPVIGVKLAM